MTLDDDARLILSPHAVHCETDAGLILQGPDADAAVALPPDAALRHMLPRLDGSRSVADLVDGAGAEGRSIRRLLASLVDCGLVWDATDLLAGADAARQLDCYYRLCDGWAHDVFVRAFWTKMLAGRASRALVLGWCEQFYHRTVGADVHNASAVAHCDDHWIRSALAAHFDEEFGHGEIFLAGLAACGLPRAEVLARPALPSTQQLIDFMDRLGRTDTIAYLGCYGVLHSPRVGQTIDAARAQFHLFTSFYPFAAPAMTAILQHAELDFAGQHDQILLEKLVDARGPLPPDQALRVLHAAHGTVACFNRFFDGIDAHYDR